MRKARGWTPTTNIVELLDFLIGRVDRRPSQESLRRLQLSTGRYHYVPFSRRAFIGAATQVRRLLRSSGRSKHPPRFVDLGCGLGDKVVIAGAMGFDALGVEIDPRLVAAGRRLYDLRRDLEVQHAPGDGPEPRAPMIRIRRGDVLDVDFGRFEVIYFWRPFADESRQADLERRIWRGVSRGSFVVAVWGVTPKPRNVELVRRMDDLGCSIFRRR